MEWIATASFGLEGVVKRELQDLSLTAQAVNGGVRFEGTALYCNADMGPAEVRQYCTLDEAGRGLMRAAMHQLNLSARAYHRILKLARTIADLAGSEHIELPHLLEAIQLHAMDAYLDP